LFELLNSNKRIYGLNLISVQLSYLNTSCFYYYNREITFTKLGRLKIVI
jgi:hypothetical protein